MSDVITTSPTMFLHYFCEYNLTAGWHKPNIIGTPLLFTRRKQTNLQKRKGGTKNIFSVWTIGPWGQICLEQVLGDFQKVHKTFVQ